MSLSLHVQSLLTSLTKFRRYGSNRLRVRRAVLGCGRGCPWRYAYPPPVFYRTSVIMEICQKILTRHASPFKVTPGHWNWQGSIGLFHGNYSPISYRFRDICQMFPPLVFNAPLSLKILSAGGRAQKARMKSLYQRFKKCDDVFIRFDTVPALDIRKRIGKTILRCACIAC